MARESKASQQAAAIKSHVRTESDERVEFISSGSTMVNLAASGKGKDGGWARGHVINIVGDKSTGKTALSLEACAQAFYFLPKKLSVVFPPIKNMNVVYNSVEGKIDFPIADMYKKRFVEGIEWTRTGTVEEFGIDYLRRVDALKPGDCLFYVIDTWDALTSNAATKRFEDDINPKKNAEDKKGSYGTEKAKYGSGFFSYLCDATEGKDATLIIVSQIRDKIDAGQFEKKYYRVGGHALDFYSHQVVWLAQIQKLERIFHGEKRAYGIRCRAYFDKNKTAKPYREGEFTILYDHGLDDVGGMCDFFYGPKAEKIKFDDEEMTRQQFIEYIESNNLEDVLIEMVENEWNIIENEIRAKRKNRFEE